MKDYNKVSFPGREVLWGKAAIQQRQSKDLNIKYGINNFLFKKTYLDELLYMMLNIVYAMYTRETSQCASAD